MENWIQCIPSSGSSDGVVQVIVENNPSTSDRSTLLKIVTSALSKTINILQKGRIMNYIAFVKEYTGHTYSFLSSSYSSAPEAEEQTAADIQDLLRQVTNENTDADRIAKAVELSDSMPILVIINRGNSADGIPDIIVAYKCNSFSTINEYSEVQLDYSPLTLSVTENALTLQ